MNDYRLRGGDDLIWFEFTKINYVDQYSPIDQVIKSEADSESKNYVEFENRKNILDVNDYLYKAFNGQPIRSSLSEIKKTATNAKNKANIIQWGGIGLILTLLIAVVWPVINLITDRTNFLKSESNQLNEKIIQQEREIIKLQEQINSINKKIQDQGNKTLTQQKHKKTISDKKANISRHQYALIIPVQPAFRAHRCQRQERSF